jgi:hypothetical protein
VTALGACAAELVASKKNAPASFLFIGRSLSFLEIKWQRASWPRIIGGGEQSANQIKVECFSFEGSLRRVRFVPKTHFHRISIDTYLQIGISWFVMVSRAVTLLSYCSRFTATWSIMSTPRLSGRISG